MASLAQTNKFLATTALRKQAVRTTIATSSAIEGIFAPFRATVSAKPTKAHAAGKVASKGGKPAVVKVVRKTR